MRMNVNGRFLWISSLLAVSTFACSQNSPALNVVPRPVSVKSLAGTFTLNDQTRILAVDKESRRIATLFKDFPAQLARLPASAHHHSAQW